MATLEGEDKAPEHQARGDAGERGKSVITLLEDERDEEILRHFRNTTYRKRDEETPDES